MIDYDAFAVEHTLVTNGFRSVSHTDANGISISPEQYNASGNDAMAGNERSSTSFEWLTADALDQTHLTDAFAVFMGQKAPTEYYPVPKPVALNALPAADEAELRRMAQARFGEAAGKFLAFSQSHVKTEAGYGAVNGIGLTVRGVFEEKARSENVKNYYYCFDADIPGWDDPGTFHSVDLWFFFETLAKCWRPFVGRHYDLARQMCNYWANFIRTGDPNGPDADGSAMPEWQPYSVQCPCAMRFEGGGARPCAKAPTDYERFLMNALLKGKDDEEAVK